MSKANMYICVIKIRLHLFTAQSLKEKRSVIKSLIRKTQNKFTLSIAEVGDHELWQSSLIGAAIVANNKRILEREMERVLAFIEQDSEFEIIEIQHEIWSF